MIALMLGLALAADATPGCDPVVDEEAVHEQTLEIARGLRCPVCQGMSVADSSYRRMWPALGPPAPLASLAPAAPHEPSSDVPPSAELAPPPPPAAASISASRGLSTRGAAKAMVRSPTRAEGSATGVIVNMEKGGSGADAPSERICASRTMLVDEPIKVDMPPSSDAKESCGAVGGGG